MRRTRAALTTLLFLFFLPPIVRAELDAVQLRLLEQFDTPLRWDNVNGAPHYFSGVKPKYHVRLQRHTVCVEPGQQTSILVSPLSVVRIEGVARYLTRDDVEVWIDKSLNVGVFRFGPGPEGGRLPAPSAEAVRPRDSAGMFSAGSGFDIVANLPRTNASEEPRISCGERTW